MQTSRTRLFPGHHLNPEFWVSGVRPKARQKVEERKKASKQGRNEKKGREKRQYGTKGIKKSIIPRGKIVCNKQVHVGLDADPYAGQ